MAGIVMLIGLMSSVSGMASLSCVYVRRHVAIVETSLADLTEKQWAFEIQSRTLLTEAGKVTVMLLDRSSPRSSSTTRTLADDIATTKSAECADLFCGLINLARLGSGSLVIIRLLGGRPEVSH